MDFKQIVETIKDKVRIENLVGEGRSVKRKPMIACVFPHHRDSSPSFSYHPETNTWRCFGCNMGGSVIDFVMARDGVDFQQAVENMAEDLNLKLTPPTKEQREAMDRAQKRVQVVEYAAEFYHRNLFSSKDGERALAYLVDDRKFSMEILKKHRIGWANGHLLRSVVKNQELKEKGILWEDFINTGLIRSKDKGDGEKRHYDHFINRIIFPLVKSGKVAGMSGRLLEGDGPKYLNMVEEQEEFPLGAPLELFNGDAARLKEVYVGEGLPDALTLLQWGLPAIGSPGTGGVDKHAARLKRARKVIFVWDNDGPGKTNALRAAQNIQHQLENGECYLIDLPAEVKDVNEFLVSGATADDFKALTAMPLVFKMIEDIPANASAGDRAELLNPIYKLIAKMPSIEQETYLQQIKVRFKISPKASREIMKALAEGASKQSSDDETLAFETLKPIVPAQDFDIEKQRAITTTYIYTIKKDENGRREKVLEPYLIQVNRTPDLKVEAKPVRAIALTDRERRRVPTESMAGRWRLEPEHPYGVANFIGGHVRSVDAAKLFDDIVALFKRYNWLKDPRDHYLIAANVMQSYLYRLFPAIGYLWFNGIRESGKSQSLMLMSEIGFNARRVASLSESTMFRSVESNCPVYFVDEAERLQNPAPGSTDQALSLLCNDSYKAGSIAQRNDQDSKTKKWAPTDFDVYCPKVFGSINDIGYVLASRCIKIRCFRAEASEMKGLKDWSQNAHREEAVLADLRDRLQCWALLHWQEIYDIYSRDLLEDPGLAHLRGREREMWLPILAIALHVDKTRFGADWTKQQADDLISYHLLNLQRVKQAEKTINESESSLDVLILQTLVDLLDAHSLTVIKPGIDDGGYWYAVDEAAKMISEQLLNGGFVTKEVPCTAHKLNGVLLKNDVINPETDKGRFRVANTPKRAVLIRRENVAKALSRLGRPIEDAPVVDIFSM